MIERVLTFGPRSELVGILSTPESAPDPLRPTVLMWNVGVNHRVGPFRSNVDLARQLAAEGFPSFRFDASGLGDSDFRRQSVPEAEREVLDVTEAMDAVTRRTSAEHFVLIGYCSSVDAAHQVSIDDSRVVGAVHIEGYVYPTLGFRRRSRRKLIDKVHWDRAIRRRVAKVLRSLGSSSGPVADGSVYTRRIPTQEEFAADLVTLTDQLRKPHLFIYSSGSGVNSIVQFSEMFDRCDIDRSCIAVRFFEGADHTFYGLQHRERMLNAVTEWMVDTFPSGPDQGRPIPDPTAVS